MSTVSEATRSVITNDTPSILRRQGLTREADAYEALCESSGDSAVPNFYFLTGRPRTVVPSCFSSIVASRVEQQIKESFPRLADVQEMREAFAAMHGPRRVPMMLYTQYKQPRSTARAVLQSILTGRLFHGLSGRMMHSVNANAFRQTPVG
jgi:hypothetical protein